MKFLLKESRWFPMLVTTLLALAVCASTPAAKSAEPQPTPSSSAQSSKTESSIVEPQAMDTLMQMSKYLRSLKTFKVGFRMFKDEVLLSGQKVMIDGTSDLTVQQPDRFHFTNKIDEAHVDQQYFYDGKTFTVYGNTLKFYASTAAPPTISELLDVAASRHKITMPFADLFIWGTDKADTAAIKSAIYVGPTTVNNVRCDHYAFRNDDVDWQLWIEKGKRPLPRKLVITTKQEEGHPQYVSIMDWTLSPAIDQQLFTFVPPKGAHKIDFAKNEVAPVSSK